VDPAVRKHPGPVAGLRRAYEMTNITSGRRLYAGFSPRYLCELAYAAIAASCESSGRNPQLTSPGRVAR
jgi:hypothetical protein